MTHNEARWLEEEDCNAQVEEAWSQVSYQVGMNVMDVQSKVLQNLWVWDKNVLGELEKRIKKTKKVLEDCRRKNISQEEINHEHILCYKLERLQDQLHVY
jgi:hypothetical protein